MKAREQDGFILQHQLQNFLINYRSTPHATMGQSPASLFLGRPLRTQVDLLRPVVGECVRGEQARQKHHHDAHGRYREFPVGTPVMMREGRHKCHWLPGTVRERHGPISYLVEMESGVWCHKHIDHLREIAVALQPQPAKPTLEVAPVPCVSIPTSPLVESSDSSSEVRIGDTAGASSREPPSSTTLSTTVVPSSSSTTGPTVVAVDMSSQFSSTRYPRQQRRPVDRFTVTD